MESAVDTPAASFRERYGEWALVTGASSGIGRSLAHGLAARGMSVVLASDEEAELERVGADIRERFGVRTIGCHVDLASPECVDTVRRATAHVDVSLLVNNASFGIVGPFEGRPFADYDRLLAVNVRAYVGLTHAYLPALRAAGRGALVFVASINALVPVGGSAIYSASKSFEVSFGSALWYELRGSGIDVLVVLPGPTKTNFQRKAGTMVAPWAMEPDDVAEGALGALGREVQYIAGERNRQLAQLAETMPLEQRIATASQYLHLALREGVDPQAR